MMLSLLSMLGGGIFRLLPEVMKLFTAKKDADHEYRMVKLQLEIDKARAEQQLDLTHAQAAIAADTAQMQAMVEALKAQATPSGVKWVDALSSSVRPVLTYWWCLVLYTTAKMIAVIVAFKAGTPLAAFAAILVTEFDTAVIGSIFSFWFVDRAIKRAGK